ncbi:MAG: hypothetical protein WAR57_10655 [Candidatus Phosphoribacter sp.]|nr:hypothetical protein [Actinomycetales bacterium]
MSDERQVPETVTGEGLTVDRRKPAVRYLEFRDLHSLQQLAVAADRTFKALLESDNWGGGITKLQPPEAPTPTVRRSFFRRPQPPAAIAPVMTTPALARVAQCVASIPAELDASPNGCSASRGVAHLLATVAGQLVGELQALTPEQQAAHAAYRQTLRLGAELEGLREVVLARPCTDTQACVVIREPGHLDRRVEDAEVAEVSAVLRQLAGGAEADPPPA